MKIKTDFITNSSSTSFIYISNIELTLEMFLSSAGIDESSPLVNIFMGFYYALKVSIDQGEEIKSINVLRKKHYANFSDQTLDKIKKAFVDGKTVKYALLSSEEDIPESLLCMEFFEIETPDFLISAENNYW